jgi:hypothetical protein
MITTTATTRRRSREQISLQGKLLTPQSIGALIGTNCKPCRSIAGCVKQSICCPNGLRCNTKFERPGGNAALLEFRQKFWATNWKTTLIDELKQCSSVLGEGEEIEHRRFALHIGSTAVCKDFFRAATAISRQVFNASYASVGEFNSSTRGVISSKMKEHESAVLGFLDSFFSGYRVQHDPTCEKKAMLYSSWKDLYECSYKDHCRVEQTKPVSRRRFCGIRHQHRPGYMIAKTFRGKKSWNHMACDLCDNFTRAINETTSFEWMKDLQRGFDDHVNRMVRILPCILSSLYLYLYLYFRPYTYMTVSFRMHIACITCIK